MIDRHAGLVEPDVPVHRVIPLVFVTGAGEAAIRQWKQAIGVLVGVDPRWRDPGYLEESDAVALGIEHRDRAGLVSVRIEEHRIVRPHRAAELLLKLAALTL